MYSTSCWICISNQWPAYEIMFRPGANSFSSGKMTDFSPAGTMTSAENTEETSAPDLAG